MQTPVHEFKLLQRISPLKWARKFTKKTPKSSSCTITCPLQSRAHSNYNLQSQESSRAALIHDSNHTMKKQLGLRPGPHLNIVTAQWHSSNHTQHREQLIFPCPSPLGAYLCYLHKPRSLAPIHTTNSYHPLLHFVETRSDFKDTETTTISTSSGWCGMWSNNLLNINTFAFNKLSRNMKMHHTINPETTSSPSCGSSFGKP